VPARGLSRLRGNRSPQAVEEWGEAFGGSSEERGRRYAEAIGAFLGRPTGAQGWERYVGGLSPHTRRAYSYALTEFFEWASDRKGRIVEPSDVTAADAQEFVQWLSNRPYGLEEARLREGDRPERLEIYLTVKRMGESRQPEIAAALPRSVKRAHQDPRDDAQGEVHDAWLAHELGRMVLHDYLERVPSVKDLRKWPNVLVTDEDGSQRWVEQRPVDVPIEVTQPWPRAGIDQDEIDVQIGDERRSEKVWNLYRYRVRQPRGVSPRTATARVSALSSFWELLLKGDGQGDPLVKSNPWYAVRRRTLRGSAKRAKRAADEQRIDGAVLVRLLQAAEQGTSLVELRNKAMVYLLVFSAVRIEELVRLRRGIPGAAEQQRWPGWFDGNEPPSIVVLRKGGETQKIPYPPIAMRALNEFHAQLDRTATKAVGSTAPQSIRYRDLATMPDAPLLPPLTMWGANSAVGYQELKPNALPPYTKSMTAPGATAALKRMGRRAGLTDPELRQVHPHALRHFAITAMVEEGKDLREVQAMAGHSSVTTTEGYLERPTSRVALSGQAEIMRYLEKLGVTEPAARPAPEKPAPRVVETRGEEAAPKRPRKPSEPAVEAPEAPPAAEVEALVELAEEPSEERLPDHDVPVVPDNPEPEVKAVETGAGQAVEVGDAVIGIDGKEPTTDLATAHAAQMIRGKSAGQPDAVYEAMEDAAAMGAVLRAAERAGESDKALAAVEELGQAQARREEIAFTTAHQRKKGSPGKTIDYQEVKEGKRRELVQRNKWLRENYDPWPLAYGIGKTSLLPWFQRGSPGPDGYVRVKGDDFPPLPVLPPEYVKPETIGGRRMMDFVENTYNEWLAGSQETGGVPSPTRASGLVRWFAFFAYTTSKLQRYMDDFRAHYTFKPWSDVCEVKRDLRSHKMEWIQAWLKANSHTYLTSIHSLRNMPRGRTLQHEHEFWQAFGRVAFEGMTLSTEIPEWFLEDDPIRALPREEYDKFEQWMANVTGQRMTRERERERADARDFSREEIKDRQDQVRGLLSEIYFPILDEVTEARKTEMAPEGIAGMENQLRTIEASLIELGAPNPRDEEFREIEDRASRIEAIVKGMAGEDDAEPAEENILAGSELFDKQWFRIDHANRTIGHAPDFAAWFYEQFGTDSELVLRRCARAMWEHVKERRWQEKGKLTSSQYNYLYSIMLTHLAWVVPAPERMERAMAESGQTGMVGGKARRAWLERHISTVRSMIYEEILPEEEGRPLTFEDQVEWLMQNQNLDRMSAESLLRTRDITEVHGAEQMRGTDLEQPGMGEAIVRGGGGRAFAPFAAQEQRKQFKREQAEFERKQREEKMKPNAVSSRRMKVNGRTVTVRRLPGEVPGTLYQVAHDFKPNEGPRAFYSLGVWRQEKAMLANQESALPSPFAMIHAMSLG
jgi:site-specific recombinase XerD